MSSSLAAPQRPSTILVKRLGLLAGGAVMAGCCSEAGATSLSLLAQHGPSKKLLGAGAALLACKTGQWALNIGFARIGPAY